MTDAGFRSVAYVTRSLLGASSLYRLRGALATRGHPVWDAAASEYVSIDGAPGSAAVPADPAAHAWVYDLVIPGASAFEVFEGSGAAPPPPGARGVLCLALGHGITSGPAAHGVLGDMAYVTGDPDCSV